MSEVMNEDLTLTAGDISVINWLCSAPAVVESKIISTESEPVIVCHPVAIEKQASSLACELVEYIERDRLDCMTLYVAEHGAQKYDGLNHTDMVASSYYANVKEQFTTYADGYINGGVPVSYVKPKHGWGRVSPYRARGLTSFAKDMRNALIVGNYYDFDLKNCQPEIIRNICVSNNIPCAAIANYCDNRDAIFIELATLYSVSNKKIKKLFLRLCFFGTFDAWKREQNVIGEASPIINEFVQNLQDIAEVIRAENNKLFQCARQGQMRQNKTNYLGSMFALYVQDYELRIVEQCADAIRNTTNLTCHDTARNSMIYEFDGIKLEKSNVDKYGGPDVVLKLLNNILKNNGWDMKFEEKAIESSIDLSIYMPRVIENRDLVNDLETGITYEALKFQHERTMFKIMSNGMFVHINDGKIIYKDERTMVSTFRHISYDEVINGKNGPYTVKKRFIDTWLDDNKMRIYDDIDVYPPHGPLKCPQKHYNLWTPFYAECLLDEYTHDEDHVNMFLSHLKILCGHNADMFEYVCMWIAQMFQHPGRKPGKMPIFYSKEGAGKGSLVRVLKRIIGNGRVIETADANDLIGKFNGMLSGAFVVCFNELSKKQIEAEKGIMKELITDDNINIKFKGIDSRSEASYHRSIGETNNRDSFVTATGDRRNVLITSSNELCGNAVYFEKFHDMIDNDDAIASIFNHFMSIPNVERFYKMKAPITDHQKELQQMSTPVVQIFVEYLVNNLAEFNLIMRVVDDKLTMSPKALYDTFTEWQTANGFKYETTSRKLSAEIGTHGIVGVSKGAHTKTGSPKIFDIPMVIDHFDKEHSK